MLPATATPVATLGQSRLKPSVYLRPTAQAISSNPATKRTTQAILSPRMMQGRDVHAAARGPSRRHLVLEAYLGILARTTLLVEAVPCTSRLAMPLRGFGRASRAPPR